MADKTIALAGASASLLYARLNPVEWADMRVRNAQFEDGPCCASHDFCDANMYMLEAFNALEVLAPVDSDDGSEAHNVACDTWNMAWDIAKREFLTERATLDDLTGVYQAFLKREGIEHEGDAMEFLMTDAPTKEQRAWVSRFVAQWDAIDNAQQTHATAIAHGL